MKKFTKVAVGATAVAAMVSAFAFAGCGAKEVTGEAYGLVHGGSYVGYAKITLKGEQVVDATLSEVCFPTQVKVGTGTSTESAEAAAAAIETTVAADDYVVVSTSKTANEVTTYTATAYYKTVSYGDVTLTYDVEKGYVSGTTALKDYFSTEANAKAYYEAVMENKVSVTLGGSKNATVMTKAKLSKEENGYWTGANYASTSKLEGESKWKANRDATIAFVKSYGTEALLKTVKASEGANEGYWVDGSVSTGATWTDLNSDTTGKGYFSYAQLLDKAAKAAK